MDFQKYFSSSSFSDVTVVYSGRELPVHKIVMCSQSKWFTKAFDGRFSEAGSSKLELVDDDPEALEDMIRSFYGLQLFTKGESEEQTTDLAQSAARLDRIIRVYVAADKYDAEGLRKQLIENFDSVADAIWPQQAFFKEGHMEKILNDIHANLPESDKLRQNVAGRISGVLNSCYSSDPKMFSQMLDRIPDLSKDIVMKFAVQLGPAIRGPHKSALHWAAQNGDLNECQLLLDAGIDVNVVDQSGEMPLHFSTFYGNADVTRLLIQKGADIHSASVAYPHGTPHRWATQQGYPEIVGLLEEAGARDVGS